MASGGFAHVTAASPPARSGAKPVSTVLTSRPRNGRATGSGARMERRVQGVRAISRWVGHG